MHIITTRRNIACAHTKDLKNYVTGNVELNASFCTVQNVLDNYFNYLVEIFYKTSIYCMV